MAGGEAGAKIAFQNIFGQVGGAAIFVFVVISCLLYTSPHYTRPDKLEADVLAAIQLQVKAALNYLSLIHISLLFTKSLRHQIAQVY